MRLAKDHLAFGAMQGAPGADPAFQRPADAMPEFGMAPHDLSKIAIGRKPGAATSIGTTSCSKTALSGSGRRRSRGSFFVDGRRGLVRCDRPWRR